MKKLISLLLCVAILFTVCSCGLFNKEEEAKIFEIALVISSGSVDDKSFNQSAWEAVKKVVAEEENIQCQWYKASYEETESYLLTIDNAVERGAKLIVCPGYLFEEAVYIAQNKHKNVKFIIIDGAPRASHTAEAVIGKNTVSIYFAEEQAGYLAGYAMVREGMRSIAFMGGKAVPAVTRYGYGFLQGAEAAGKELSLKDKAVKINYHYTDSFYESIAVEEMADKWYKAGTQVIFACGGQMGRSVMNAAEKNKNKFVIGVDADQSYMSKIVVASATKNIGKAVRDCIIDYLGKDFQGGKMFSYDASLSGVGLTMKEESYGKDEHDIPLYFFRNFYSPDYNAVYNKLVSNSIDIIKDTDTDGNKVEIEDLKLSVVEVRVS